MRKKEYDGDFIEELISIARESTRSYLELIKLRNKARDFLDNLKDAIEAAVEEEIKRSGICPEEKTIHLGEEEPRINIEIVRIRGEYSDPSDPANYGVKVEIDAPLYGYLDTVLKLYEKRREIIKHARKQVEEWRKKSEEGARVLKALENALTPLANVQ